MESTNTGWWRRHGWTVAILLTAFGISFAIRTIWAYPVISQYGALFTYGGGSDSYYHSRVMQYIIQTHTNLIHDPLLKFPVGAINPREPLFDWMNAILGIVFAPFFGGNATAAGAWFLDLQAPLWAALGVFPVYLIGREVLGKRAGLIAALIFPFLSANIDSSIFGYANYLSFYTFIILVVVYSYIRTVKAVGSRRWVESYRHPGQYLPALRAFLRTERSAVKWAVFTGVSLGALALAWQGYTYGVVVIAISVLVAMVAERVRRVDSFGLYVVTWIVGLVGFPMAMPYYLVQQQFTAWFDLPLLIYFGVLALLLPFLLMRDIPWVFSIPFLVGVVAAGVGALAAVSPTDFTALVTGQGYFVKTLIYSTVAEAQAPSIDTLVLGYGVVTFFLTFAGLAVFVYLLVKGRFKRHHIVFLVFAIISIYLPISAAKFFLVGSPIFALLPSEVITRALDIAGYGELRRTTASLSDRRSQFSAFRKAFKPRHVLVMILVVGIVLPNVWVAIDAGIPGNTKTQYAEQVGSTLPPWVQLNASNPGQYYFGAAGSSLDTPNQYDSAGYNWLSQQDTNLPPADRPAFVSWWDYGFQAIDQGQHPSVADNFQNGIDPAGQFLLSQNESQAIAVLATTLLQAEQRASGEPNLPPALNAILAADGIDTTELHNLLVNTSSDFNLVVAHPNRYLPVNPATLTDDNAMYLAVEYFLATSLPLSGVAKVYNDIQSYTGWTIRYAMTDSRLIPFSGTDTGIFYAPADLTGRVLDANGEPETFFNLSQLGSDGNYYPYGQLPAGVTAVGSPVINYKAPFFNSMIYRTYFGYNGTEAGLGSGIPGLSINSTIEPGWMLQHFQVVYKTAYLCSRANNSGTCVAENQPTAIAAAARTNGSADTTAFSYFSGGESMLQYFPGQTLLGEVQLPSGAPVGGARVTVDDSWGIPHMTVLTAPDGTFSIVLPPGNDTLNVTTGPLQGLSQQGSILLKTFHVNVPSAIGLSLDPPNLVQSFTVGSSSVQGFIYWHNSVNATYNPLVDRLIPGAQVVLWGSNLTRLTATTDASGSFAISNIAPGVYHYNVLYGGTNFSQSAVTVSGSSPTNATVGLMPGFVSGLAVGPNGRTPVAGATVTISDARGVVESTTTAGLGTYDMKSIGPGNYTVVAFDPASNLRAPGVPVTISLGSNVTANFTLVPSGTSTFVLTANGAVAPDVPVRFTPIASLANSSLSPIGALAAASANGTVIVSSSSGTVTAALPAGSYSVYAAGIFNGQSYTAIGRTTIVAGVSSSATLLPLSPSVSLSGSVAPVPQTNGTTRSAVLAYASNGGEVATWATGGAFAFSLPAGSYSLLSLVGANSSSAPVWAALQGVSLSTPTSVALAPVSALRAQFTVAAVLASGSLYPATGATASVSAGPSGPAVSAVANSTGTVTLYVPASLAISGGSYCLRTSAPGFVPTSTCPLTPTALSALTTVRTTLAPVPVTLTVLGLPSGTSVTVNLTAESSTATNQSLYGGPTFSFTAAPGSYTIGARGTTGSGTVVYLPPGIVSETVPLGANHANISLTVLAQVNATGRLTLPSGAPAQNVTVSLSSPLQNVTVDGHDFEKGFRAAPGRYSAYATVKVGHTNYTSLSRVTIATDGNITPTVVLSTVGPTLAGVTKNATGAIVSLNATAFLVAPGGAVASAPLVDGNFSLSLAGNTTYSVFLNGSSLVPGPNGSYVQSWAVRAGATCILGSTSSPCSIPLVGAPVSVWLNGTLVASGVPGPLSGTVRLVGPYPSTNVTLVSASSGAFSTRLVPGAYSLYATGGGGSGPYANLTHVLALPSQPAYLTVSLVPTWLDTISVAPPSSGAAGLGPVTVTITDALGTQAVYTGQAPNTPLPLALPAGTYLVRATAVGTLGGVVSNASAQSTVTIANGNVGTVLTLAYTISTQVSGTIVGPAASTVAAGHNVTFAFTVRNTGNVPVTVVPVGSPSYWTFSFSFANVTLEPGATASSASGEVRIWVPWGTPVLHPGVTIQFETTNGTVVGSVNPAPVVSVVGYYGLASGVASVPPDVSPTSVQIPFYVENSGNLGETVVATISDAARIQGLGWTTGFASSTAPNEISAFLAAGANMTLYVNLTAASAVFVPPGTVTVALSVVNATGSISAVDVLKVPVASVSANSGLGQPPVTVTGPSVVGAPNLPPAWLIPLLSFVPAIALVVGVVAYRWWRTRRWTRR
jgi:dolichyl-phosphooligosaccharide-protein glycotransferase